jgi:hypothetical protein
MKECKTGLAKGRPLMGEKGKMNKLKKVKWLIYFKYKY